MNSRYQSVVLCPHRRGAVDAHPVARRSWLQRDENGRRRDPAGGRRRSGVQEYCSSTGPEQDGDSHDVPTAAVRRWGSSLPAAGGVGAQDRRRAGYRSTEWPRRVNAAPCAAAHRGPTVLPMTQSPAGARRTPREPAHQPSGERSDGARMAGSTWVRFRASRRSHAQRFDTRSRSVRPGEDESVATPLTGRILETQLMMQRPRMPYLCGG